MHASKSSISRETPELVIKSIFQRYDEDGDGSLNLKEFANAMDDLGIVDEYEQAALFALADADNSKTIEPDEFMRLIKGHDFEVLLSNRDDYLFVIETYKTFQEYDIDCDGEISWDEFYHYLTGHGYSHEYISQYWHYLDNSKSSSITFDEFWKGFKAQAEALTQQALHEQLTEQLLGASDKTIAIDEFSDMSPIASPDTYAYKRKSNHKVRLLGGSRHQRIKSLKGNKSWNNQDKNNIFRVMKRHLKKTKTKKRSSGMQLGRVIESESDSDDIDDGHLGLPVTAMHFKKSNSMDDLMAVGLDFQMSPSASSNDEYGAYDGSDSIEDESDEEDVTDEDESTSEYDSDSLDATGSDSGSMSVDVMSSDEADGILDALREDIMSLGRGMKIGDDVMDDIEGIGEDIEEKSDSESEDSIIIRDIESDDITDTQQRDEILSKDVNTENITDTKVREDDKIESIDREGEVEIKDIKEDKKYKDERNEDDDNKSDVNNGNVQNTNEEGNKVNIEDITDKMENKTINIVTERKSKTIKPIINDNDDKKEETISRKEGKSSKKEDSTKSEANQSAKTAKISKNDGKEKKIIKKTNVSKKKEDIKALNISTSDPTPNGTKNKKKGYQFGDITKGIIQTIKSKISTPTGKSPKTPTKTQTKTKETTQLSKITTQKDKPTKTPIKSKKKSIVTKNDIKKHDDTKQQEEKKENKKPVIKSVYIKKKKRKSAVITPRKPDDKTTKEAEEKTNKTPKKIEKKSTTTTQDKTAKKTADKQTKTDKNATKSDDKAAKKTEDKTKIEDKTAKKTDDKTPKKKEDKIPTKTKDKTPKKPDKTPKKIKDKTTKTEDKTKPISKSKDKTVKKEGKTIKTEDKTPPKPGDKTIKSISKTKNNAPKFPAKSKLKLKRAHSGDLAHIRRNTPKRIQRPKRTRRGHRHAKTHIKKKSKKLNRHKLEKLEKIDITKAAQDEIVFVATPTGAVTPSTADLKLSRSDSKEVKVSEAAAVVITESKDNTTEKKLETVTEKFEDKKTKKKLQGKSKTLRLKPKKKVSDKRASTPNFIRHSKLKNAQRNKVKKRKSRKRLKMAQDDTLPSMGPKLQTALSNPTQTSSKNLKPGSPSPLMKKMKIHKTHAVAHSVQPYDLESLIDNALSPKKKKKKRSRRKKKSQKPKFAIKRRGSLDLDTESVTINKSLKNVHQINVKQKARTAKIKRKKRKGRKVKECNELKIGIPRSQTQRKPPSTNVKKRKKVRIILPESDKHSKKRSTLTNTGNKVSSTLRKLRESMDELGKKQHKRPKRRMMTPRDIRRPKRQMMTPRDIRRKTKKSDYIQKRSVGRGFDLFQNYRVKSKEEKQKEQTELLQIQDQLRERKKSLVKPDKLDKRYKKKGSGKRGKGEKHGKIEIPTPFQEKLSETMYEKRPSLKAKRAKLKTMDDIIKKRQNELNERTPKIKYTVRARGSMIYIEEEEEQEFDDKKETKKKDKGKNKGKDKNKKNKEKSQEKKMNKGQEKDKDNKKMNKTEQKKTDKDKGKNKDKKVDKEHKNNDKGKSKDKHKKTHKGDDKGEDKDNDANISQKKGKNKDKKVDKEDKNKDKDKGNGKDKHKKMHKGDDKNKDKDNDMNVDKSQKKGKKEKQNTSISRSQTERKPKIEDFRNTINVKKKKRRHKRVASKHGSWELEKITRDTGHLEIKQKDKKNKKKAKRGKNVTNDDSKKPMIKRVNSKGKDIKETIKKDDKKQSTKKKTQELKPLKIKGKTRKLSDIDAPNKVNFNPKSKLLRRAHSNDMQSMTKSLHKMTRKVPRKKLSSKSTKQSPKQSPRPKTAKHGQKQQVPKLKLKKGKSRPKTAKHVSFNESAESQRSKSTMGFHQNKLKNVKRGRSDYEVRPKQKKKRRDSDSDIIMEHKEIGYNIRVKVLLGRDIRRWRYSEGKKCNLASLKRFVTTSFGVNVSAFRLQYEDDEGDLLTLTSAKDLTDAFECAMEEDRKSLKIYVIQATIAMNNNIEQSTGYSATVDYSNKNKKRNKKIKLNIPHKKGERKRANSNIERHKPLPIMDEDKESIPQTQKRGKKEKQKEKDAFNAKRNRKRSNSTNDKMDNNKQKGAPQRSQTEKKAKKTKSVDDDDKLIRNKKKKKDKETKSRTKKKSNKTIEDVYD